MDGKRHRAVMFNACAPVAAQCGRKKAPKVKPEWAKGFEEFRKERAELTPEEAERAWEAQKTAMMQDEEVSTRLYAEMDMLEGPGGGRSVRAVREEFVSETCVERRLAKRTCARRRRRM